MNTTKDSDTAQDVEVNNEAEVATMERSEETNDDEKEKMTATTTTEVQEKSEKEEGDCCSICLDELPTDATKFVRWTCCGNGMHKHCDKDLASMKMDGSCPLCRAKTPTSHEEVIKYLHPWVKKKKSMGAVNDG